MSSDTGADSQAALFPEQSIPGFPAQSIPGFPEQSIPGYRDAAAAPAATSRSRDDGPHGDSHRDAGSQNAGSQDAGSQDSGTGEDSDAADDSTRDADPQDSGTGSEDSGSQDSGTGSEDSGSQAGAGGVSVPSLAALGCVSDADLLALLDRLAVPGTHDSEDAQDAILAAQIAALEDDVAVLGDARNPRDADASNADASNADASNADASNADAAGHSNGHVRSPAWIGECLPAGPGLAAVLAAEPPGAASDWDLPGLAAGYRRLAAWAQARELAAVAEIAARCAAANPGIRIGEGGQPDRVPPEAAAQVALELIMSQPAAAGWMSLAAQLRWQLPGTGAALADGRLDLPRVRIIADAFAPLDDELAAAVEQRILDTAPGQTTGQLRAVVRRAVLSADPEGAEERRRAAERRARVHLYPEDNGTATLTGTSLPGIHAAAAMARITAMARALKASGAHGGLDLLRTHIYLGLLLGTLPLIPPPGDDPGPQPPDNPGDGGNPGTPTPASGNTDSGGTGSSSSSEPVPADAGPGAPSRQTRADDPGTQPAPPGGSATPSRQTRADDPGTQPAPPGGSATPSRQQPPADPGTSPARADDPGASPDRPSADSDGTGPGLPGSQHGDLEHGDLEHGDLEHGDLEHSDLLEHGDLLEHSDLPGPWTDIPCPADADAPPAGADPPVPPFDHARPAANDEEDDRLPAPTWSPLPSTVPAAPPTSGTRVSGARPPAGLLDVVAPWTALSRPDGAPGQLSRIGPVTSFQTRQLLVAAALSPITRWHIVLTDNNGRALDSQRLPSWLPAAYQPGRAAAIGTVSVAIPLTAVPEQEPGDLTDLPADTPPILDAIAGPLLHAACTAARRYRDTDAIAAGGCAHTLATTAYRPGPRLRDAVAIRDRTCRFPPCGQPAWRTDLDHTVAWQRGGPTCKHNLGGGCRTHHRIKQLPGWNLEQPQPGAFRWTTPAGRTYLTRPDPYPI